MPSQLELFNYNNSDKIPAPKTHEPHYLLHRYWGRKPVNVFNYLIAQNTKKGETVYDPFAGSGITVIESNFLQRKSIGIDLNPLSKFITEVTLTKLDKKSLESDFKKIITLPKDVRSLYLTTYKKKTYEIKTAIWHEGKYEKLAFIDQFSNKLIKKPSTEDNQIIIKSKKLLEKYRKDKLIEYSDAKIFNFVKRSGIETIDKLFTERNLLTLSLLKKNIKKIKSTKNRKFFLLVLSSILPATSSMIPGDRDKVTGKSGWVISKFWKPKTHVEQNPLEIFSKKASQSIKAKLDINSKITNTDYVIKTRSSESDVDIKNKSIDLILTDPPYGNSISYLAISMLWNEWLDCKVNYKKEIIIDSSRKKDIIDYTERLKKVFSTCYRVLKDNKKLIFTFHNRYIKYWKAVMDSCCSSGFKLVEIEWISQANSSGTQGINKKNTLRGDFIYTFVKSKKISYDENYIPGNCEDKIVKHAVKLLQKHKKVTMAKMFEHLIPFIVNKQLYSDDNGNVLDLDEILNNNFLYKKTKLSSGYDYLWQIK